jgi:Cu-Zn family superoxide dismutase
MGKNLVIFCTLLIVTVTLSCKQMDVPLAEEYPLSAKDSKPEGVTFDPIDRAFYAGSLDGGTITRVDADGTESVFFDLDSDVSFSGMKVDALNRRLWVCASFRDSTIPLGEEGSLYTEIWIFDLVSGKKTHAYSLPAIVPYARCNDFNLDENGIGFFPDSQKPNIYKIDPQEDTGTLYVENNPILEPESTLSDGLRFFVPGSNGVVVTPDARYLLIANTPANTLFRVSLSDPSDIIEVVLLGDDFTAPDGLVMFNQTLYAVSSGKIHQVTFTSTTFDEGTVQSIDSIGGTTTGTRAEDQLYVIKSLVKAEDETDFPLIIKVDLSLFDEM